MTVKLPKPIAEYFAAANTDDADSVAACFAEDAVVRDEWRDVHGRAAIRAWGEDVRRKYHFQAEATTVEEVADQTVVTAHLAGDSLAIPSTSITGSSLQKTWRSWPWRSADARRILRKARRGHGETAVVLRSRNRFGALRAGAESASWNTAGAATRVVQDYACPARRLDCWRAVSLRNDW